MNKQEFVDNLTEFLQSNSLSNEQMITLGETEVILDITGKSAKLLLADWLADLKATGQIVDYTQPTADDQTGCIHSYIIFRRKEQHNIFAGYAFSVYSEYDSVICDTLPEAIEELKNLNKITDLTWKLKLIKPEEL